MIDVTLARTLNQITIPDPITTGEVNEATNEVSDEENESNANLRVTVANSLGVSGTTSDTSVAAATQTVNDILLKYTSARSAASSSSVLIDIYTIMDLMQEMAQKLRDAMRELRQLELTTIQTNIKNQAAQERTAALTQLVAGCVTFAMQATVAISSTYKSIKGINQEMSAQTAQGLDVAKSQADIAGLGESTKAIDAKVESLGKELDPNTKNEVDQQFQQAKVKVTHDELASKVDTAKAKLTDLTKTQAQTDVNNAQAKVDAAQAEVDEAKANVESAKNALPAAKAAVESAQAKVHSAEDSVRIQQTGVDEAQAKVDAAKAKVATAERTLKSAEQTLQLKKIENLGDDPARAQQVTEAENQVAVAKQDLASAKTELEVADTKLQVAENKLTHATDRLDTAKANLNLKTAEVSGLENAANGTELADASTKLETAKTELETAKTAQADGKSVTESAEMTATKAEIEATSHQISQVDANGHFNPNASSYEDIAEQAEVEYNRALKQVNAERAMKEGVQPESQKKLDNAAKKLNYARAREIQSLQGTVSGDVKIDNISDRLTASYGNKLKAADLEGNKVSKVIVYATVAMQMSDALGRLGQQMGDSIAAWQKAKATEMQADEKANEEQLNQLQEMFSNMMSTIEKVLSLYSSVTQKESQTIEEISGAIRG